MGLACPGGTRLTALSLGLIIGGAFGNAIDRVAYGAVMDFVLFHITTQSFSFIWYVFNLADAAIVAGVVGLLYESFVQCAPQKRPDPPGRMAEVAPSGAAKVVRYRGVEPAEWMIAMRDERSGTSLRRLLMACACGALLALPAAACAQQAQDDEDTFEQKIIKNILGGMGVDVGRPGIDYRERSPLVIPPTLDLPPPQSGRHRGQQSRVAARSGPQRRIRNNTNAAQRPMSRARIGA